MYENSNKGPVLFIRHGETEYNAILLNTPVKEAQLNEAYLDCPLSTEGKRQACELGEKLKDINIKIVFCSPLTRCLETVNIALQNHYMRQEIQVIVHPLISEVIHSCHDISCSIKTKKEIYNEDSEVKFSWELFDKYFPQQNQDFYFLHSMDNLDQEEIKEIQSKEEGIVDGYYKALLAPFILNNRRPESLNHLNMRTLKFLQYLCEFIDAGIDKESGSKVLVMTHSAVIRMSTSEKSKTLEYVDSYPDDCYRADNCEVFTLNIFNPNIKKAA